MWDERTDDQCQFIENLPGVTVLKNPNSERTELCGSSFIPGIEDCYEVSGFQNPDEIESLLSKTKSTLKRKNLSKNKIANLQELRFDLYEQLCQLVVSNKTRTGMTKESIIAELLAQPEFNIRALAPTLYMNEGDYSKARTSLEALSAKNEIEQNYLTVQKYYLDFLESGRFGISENKIKTLKTIGLQDGAYNAYAQTIYYIITGESLDMPIPYGSEEKKGSLSLNSSRSIHCYPNPVHQGSLNLEIKENAEKTYKYKLHNLTGVTVLQGNVSSKENTILKTDLLSSGIYILTIITDKKELIFTERITVIN